MVEINPVIDKQSNLVDEKKTLKKLVAISLATKNH